MLTAQDFLTEIDNFLTASKMAPSAFGRAAVGDPNFVGDLRAGRMPNLRIVGRVSEYITREQRSQQRRKSRAA
jgi:hypothetical protein